MALYVNGRPVNPVVQFLVTACVLAAAVALGVFLLPIVGGILLFILGLGLFAVVGLWLYATYFRMRYGDPMEKLREQMAQAQRTAGGAAPGDAVEPAAPAEPTVNGDIVRAGVRRTTRVEEAVIVEEIDHRREP